MSFLDFRPATRGDILAVLAKIDRLEKTMSAFANLITAIQAELKDVSAVVKDSAAVLTQLASTPASDFDPVAAQTAADQLNAADADLQAIDQKLKDVIKTAPPAPTTPTT